MLTSELLEQWIAGNNRFAFHQTEEYALERILAQGLRPWDEETDPDWQGGEWQGWVRPRVGRVYLWTAEKTRGFPPAIRVDLRSLDPARFGCDEDRIRPDWGLEPPARVGADWQPGDMTLGEWADLHAQLVDAPERVLSSMQPGARNPGSIAYQGRISPDALELNPRFVAEMNRLGQPLFG